MTWIVAAINSETQVDPLDSMTITSSIRCRRNHGPQRGVKGSLTADCLWTAGELPSYDMREVMGVEGKEKGINKKKEIKNFNRARGKCSTNQIHSAEITDELSTLLVIN